MSDPRSTPKTETSTTAALKKLHGLDASASDQALLAASRKVVGQLERIEAQAREDAEINKLVGDSFGALNRKTARQVIANRREWAKTPFAKSMVSKPEKS
jgi:hypothetical protein